MTRHGGTKDRILGLISKGSNNLSEISKTLQLAPSTVSKHIHDLESSGEIEQMENSHVKKWKYYRLRDEANVTAGYTPNRDANRTGFATKRNAIGITLAVCALIGLFSLLHVYNAGVASGTSYVQISITDPPVVPSGTQALYINYSAVSVHTDYDGRSEWIPVNSSGRLDLMSLINESQVIGGTDIASNSTIDQIEFDIVSASITVDNVTYPVTVARKQIVAAVMNKKEVNDTSGVLLDFSPVVTPVYSDNATTFVLNPSLMAAMVPGTGFGQAQPGLGKQYPLQQKYADMFRENETNLTITGTALASEGNDTTFSITLKNDGTGNVTVMESCSWGT